MEHNAESNAPSDAHLSLLDALIAAAEQRQLPVQRQGPAGVSLRLEGADVLVSVDSPGQLLMFECTTDTKEAGEVLAACLPLEAAANEEGSARVLDFAEMLALVCSISTHAPASEE